MAKHEIVLVLSDVADSQWTPGTAGNFFTAAHIAEPSAATVRPAWRMQLGGDQLSPVYQNRPLEFITTQSTTLDAQQCILLTTALR